jgi:hypothetical protein
MKQKVLLALFLPSVSSLRHQKVPFCPFSIPAFACVSFFSSNMHYEDGKRVA